MELSRLVEQLEAADPDSPIFSSIPSLPLFFRALRELQAMVEMDKIKKSIADQVRHFLVGSAAGRSEVEMLHCIISGPPGVGKTTVAKILAKIWLAMGLIRPPPPREQREEPKAARSSTDPDPQIALYRRAVKRAGAEIRKLQIQNLSLGKKISKLGSLVSAPEAGKREEVEGLVRRAGEYLTQSQQCLRRLSTLAETLPAEGEKEPVFVVATREDFVGKYVGHTAPKTRAVLERALGGVLFIDEAYSLVAGTEDNNDFGAEALTVINEFMSLYPGEILIIFSGYRELMEKTIFRVQPGLRRRVAWSFEAENYSAKGLAEILKKQLQASGWSLSPEASENAVDFFRRHKEDFPHQGGDTLRLAFHAKLAFSNSAFEKSLGAKNTPCLPAEITLPMLETALKSLQENKFDKTESPPPLFMFS